MHRPPVVVANRLECKKMRKLYETIYKVQTGQPIDEVKRRRKRELPPEEITKKVGDFEVTWPGNSMTQYVHISVDGSSDGLNKKEVKQLITVLTQFHKKMS